MYKIWLCAAAISGLTATIFAAAAAHANLNPAQLDMVREAAGLQGWHSAALLGTGLLARTGNRFADAASACFVVGLLLFCGAVYSLALANLHLSMIAPAGGFTLMAGWLLLAIAAWRA